MNHSEQNQIPTAHIEAKKNDFAKTVLMPGDPLRAQYIAETFLEDAKKINNVRGMFAFTGEYKGVKVSVMGSGMGMPSIGIYSYELYKFYDVENIIRIGSCGAYLQELKIYDVLIADKVYSDSSFAIVQNGSKEEYAYPSQNLNAVLKSVAMEANIPLKPQTIHSSDVFYKESGLATENLKLMQEQKIGAVEMESFALFTNARVLGKNAACILTVSDSLVSGQVTTSQERQTAFKKMMKIGLEAAAKLG